MLGPLSIMSWTSARCRCFRAWYTMRMTNAVLWRRPEDVALREREVQRLWGMELRPGALARTPVQRPRHPFAAELLGDPGALRLSGIEGWDIDFVGLWIPCDRLRLEPERRLEVLELARSLGPLACSYCLCELGDADVQLDHRLPVAGGGSSCLDNLTPSCRRCNIRKGDRTARWYLGCMRAAPCISSPLFQHC